MTVRLDGKRVLVAGLGVSGTVAAEALLRAGAQVRAVDAAAVEVVNARARRLGAAGADTVVGASLSPSLLDGVDLVVASPGIREGSALLTAACAAGLPVWSEPELAWRLLGGGRTRLVAVTGTNGKTTTTELLAACLDAPAAGNIGDPLVSLLSASEPPPLVVAELSSFQLRFTDALRADVGVLLNLAPDHLDWHGCLDRYAEAKARVWANQRPGHDWAVVNADDPGARRVLAEHRPPAAVRSFTTDPPVDGQVGIAEGWIVEHGADGRFIPIVEVAALRVRGRHNLANVCAAAAAALAAGAPAAALGEPLASYVPGAHRLQEVADVGGIRWVDDSKATNPHAAAAALDSYERVVWIAGGLNKDLDLTDLAAPVTRRVVTAITIGAAGPDIAALTEALDIPTYRAGDLEVAVRIAAVRARSGDVVLLAPACASMDQFVDYAQRGDRFRELVETLVAAPSQSGAPASEERGSTAVSGHRASAPGSDHEEAHGGR